MRELFFLNIRELSALILRQNQAAQKASGEFISLLYADDYYMPNKIEHQLEIFSTLVR